MLTKISAEDRGHGGVREGSGRKPDWFKEKCADLACSPKFFTFAEKVFNGELVEPKITKEGLGIYMEASVGDKVYLWEKLAAYGFGKPTEIVSAVLSRTPEDSKRKAEELWEIIKSLEVHANARTGVRGDPVSVVGGTPQVQA